MTHETPTDETDGSTDTINSETYDEILLTFEQGIKRSDMELFETASMALEKHGLDREAILDEWLADIVIEEANERVSCSWSHGELLNVTTENFSAYYSVSRDGSGCHPSSSATWCHDELGLEVEIDEYPSFTVGDEIRDACREAERNSRDPHPSLSAAERNPHLAGRGF